MDNSVKSQIINSRVEEMAAREKIVSELRTLNLGSRTTRALLEKELGYSAPETRQILAQLGLIITSETLTSADPEIRTKIDRLRAWRGAKARTAGVPAYRILSNRVLMKLATEQPKTDESLRDLKGMGPKTMEAFGRELIELLKCETREIDLRRLNC